MKRGIPGTHLIKDKNLRDILVALKENVEELLHIRGAEDNRAILFGEYRPHTRLVNKVQDDLTESIRLANSLKLRIANLELVNRIEREVVVVTDDYTILRTDHCILADTTAKTITVTAPTAFGATGKEYQVKNIGTTGNSAFLEFTGFEECDGKTSLEITSMTCINIKSDNSGWWIV